MNTLTTLKLGIGLVFFSLLGIFLANYSILALTIAGGFALYFIIDQILDTLKRWDLTHAQSYLILTLLCMITIVAGILYISIPLFEQVQNLAQRLPELAVSDQIATLEAQYPFLNGAVDRFKSGIVDLLNSLLGASGAIFTALVTIPIITTTLLATRNELRETIASLIPNDYFEVTMTIGNDIITHIRDFIWAKTLETLCMIVIYAIGFWLIGMPSFLLLSLVCGLLNIIPYIGPLLTLVPIALFALLGGGKLLILGIVVLGIAQLIDNSVLQTWLVAKYVDIHPLLAIIVTLVGGELLGMLGLIAAIPLFVIGKLLIVGYYQALLAIERHQQYLAQEQNHVEN